MRIRASPAYTHFSPQATTIGLTTPEDKLDRVFFTNEAAKRGTELHALAHDLIRLGVKLPKTRATLNMYVNDAIGFV